MYMYVGFANKCVCGFVFWYVFSLVFTINNIIFFIVVIKIYIHIHIFINRSKYAFEGGIYIIYIYIC